MIKKNKKQKKGNELRVQYLLPYELNKRLKNLPLIFLPVAPLEWHGPHLVLGTDCINAERVALAAARRLGGVVLPTLHIGTERERDPKTLQSLGFDKNEYVVGMDFPKARGLYRSFYFPEEVFALVVRGYIELSIAHGYRFIYIINGHGAVNHNEVLKRLCAEFSNKGKGIQVACSIAFPRLEVERGSIAHAGYEETSLLRYYDEGFVDLSCLPHRRKKLKYTEYSIVDSGGFSGRPGDGYAVPDDLDPRIRSSKNLGKKLFDRTVEDIVSDVRKILVTKKKRER